MKRLPSHCAQRKTSVSVVVDVVTSKLRQQPQTMPVAEITPIPSPYLARSWGGGGCCSGF